MKKTVYSKEYERFIGSLIAARKAASITQQRLAEILDKPQSFVSKYERKERRIDVVEFVEICISLGVDPIEIFLTSNLWPRSQAVVEIKHE